jgi:N-acetylmuramoyl-L-alanine amidase
LSSFIERPSPNCDARPDGAAIDILLVHYTGMKSAEEALARLCDPVARVSAHYTIDVDGRIYRHVDEMLRAWHAGVSYWAGERNVNGRSVGIELVNPGHEFGYVPFPEPQIESLIDLAMAILARHPIPPRRVLGHSDVAPARKQDPGELFPWHVLAEQGIGIFPCVSVMSAATLTSPWPAPEPATQSPHVCAANEFGSEKASMVRGRSPLGGRVEPGHGGKVTSMVGALSFADALRKFGYGVPPEIDIPPATVVTAFQRHFRPETVDGIADEETQARLSALLKLIV